MAVAPRCGYRGIYRAISGADPGDNPVTEQGRSRNRRGHGNSILNNEQQVFTFAVNCGNTEETFRKALEMGWDSMFGRGEYAVGKKKDSRASGTKAQHREHDHLTDTDHISQDSRLSRVVDAAFLPEQKALAGDPRARAKAPGSL